MIFELLALGSLIGNVFQYFENEELRELVANQLRIIEKLHEDKVNLEKRLKDISFFHRSEIKKIKQEISSLEYEINSMITEIDTQLISEGIDPSEFWEEMSAA